jgi:hypothetical protein
MSDSASEISDLAQFTVMLSDYAMDNSESYNSHRNESRFVNFTELELRLSVSKPGHPNNTYRVVRDM